jgi:uncharacterized membrane protein YhaH (DUF805 family)
MSFLTAMRTCLGKYVTFAGRASRSEFWYFQLFIFLVFFGMVVLVPIVPDTAETVGIASCLFYLAMLSPSLAATVRRLHDRNRSGWHYWWVLVPIVGGLILLIWLCKRGVEGENRFGPDPLAVSPPKTKTLGVAEGRRSVSARVG